jgi:hypothetical protein
VARFSLGIIKDGGEEIFGMKINSKVHLKITVDENSKFKIQNSVKLESSENRAKKSRSKEISKPKNQKTPHTH